MKLNELFDILADFAQGHATERRRAADVEPLADQGGMGADFRLVVEKSHPGEKK